MTHLILHKVRGEPAFDVASRIHCPLCEGARQGLDHGEAYMGNCGACDDGYWWIIPTSGHRAYPYVEWPLNSILPAGAIDPENVKYAIPPDHPDHYECNDTGTALPAGATVLSIIAKLMPKMKDRRF